MHVNRRGNWTPYLVSAQKLRALSARQSPAASAPSAVQRWRLTTASRARCDLRTAPQPSPKVCACERLACRFLSAVDACTICSAGAESKARAKVNVVGLGLGKRIDQMLTVAACTRSTAIKVRSSLTRHPPMQMLQRCMWLTLPRLQAAARQRVVG